MKEGLRRARKRQRKDGVGVDATATWGVDPVRGGI